MGRGQRDLARERQWRQHVARWQASELSVREFCQRHGLIETAFYYWKRVLRARDAAVTVKTAITSAPTISSPQSPAVPKPSPMFVPVTVIPAATLSVEVRYPSGHVVIVSACDATSLASLFAALNPPTRGERSC